MFLVTHVDPVGTVTQLACRRLVHPEYSLPISQVPGYRASSCGRVVEQADEQVCSRLF